MIKALSHRVVLLWGWRRALAAFAAGALGALAMPPFGLFPVLAVSFTVAIWLLDGATGAQGRILPSLRAAAWIGWCFGFGYFLAGLWWIGQAFLVDADDFAWLMPFAVVLLPAGLALFHALGFALARLVWPAGPARILGFAAALAAVEWLRGHVLTGFPWNAFGYALAGEIHLAQTLSLIGLPGLTLLAVAILASPAALADDRALFPRARRAPLAALAVLVLMAGFGAWRLSTTDVGTVDAVRLRIMQPAIPQDDKFRPSLRDQVMRQYLTLSDQATSPQTPGMTGVTHLIWPESAFPFILSQDADALADIASLLPPGATLLTGAGRVEEPGPGETDPRYYNAVHVIDSNGTILDSYDKVHLVPFGEYLPFQRFLESIGLRQLTQLRGGFTPGPRLRTLDIPGAPPAGILVCYEAIFPGQVVDRANRPQWLLNVTNDAWFGLTPGPYQHFLQARARSIEEGLPLVRAANDGISAVIDPVGRVIASLPLGTRGVLDSTLPKALPATLYAGGGDTIFAGILLLFLAVAVLRRVRP
ncbi:apolipoprotein N-acyltransferase [Labrys wisconsinensis]|uniref:Apolipoprotein N-acyltransferase n=1 Tax=Labrys wisconsinensis TaxID=425677 RepID=A0ABU0JFW0_9HYPH|nr:apolipoprotein N-acyltransferase [Labrys wisconsinensis]MDQ0472366.1 apolipoprotein N-acyltransferase [Labrys wisconsinensis]